MENRSFHFLLMHSIVLMGVVLFGYHPWLLASESNQGDEPNLDKVIQQEPIIQPEIERREITEDQIDTEDFELGVYVGIMSIEDFGSNTVVGLRLAYHVSEDFFIEMAYAQTTAGRTSAETISGGVQLLTDEQRELTYYNVSIGYNVLPGEAFVTKNLTLTNALYLITGVGNTDFAGDERFTFNFGAGYRLLATDWLAIHGDVRDHMFDIDITGEDKTTHNIEIHLGLTFFF